MPNLFLGFPVSRSKFAELAASALTSLYDSIDLYMESHFESLDGWDVYVTGSGAVALQNTQLLIHTGTTSGSVAGIYERQNYPIGILTWNKKRRFKVRVRVDVYSDASSQIFICTGDEAANQRGFGFRYQNTKLIGWAQNGGAYATVDLITELSAPYSRTETLEAVLTPCQDIKFYVDGVYKGNITTNLPTGTTNADRFIRMVTVSEAAVDHSIYTSAVKFSQDT